MSSEVLENESVMARLSCAESATHPHATRPLLNCQSFLQMFDTVAHNLQPNDADICSTRWPGTCSIQRLFSSPVRCFNCGGLARFPETMCLPASLKPFSRYITKTSAFLPLICIMLLVMPSEVSWRHCILPYVYYNHPQSMGSPTFVGAIVQHFDRCQRVRR